MDDAKAEAEEAEAGSGLHVTVGNDAVGRLGLNTVLIT